MNGSISQNTSLELLAPRQFDSSALSSSRVVRIALPASYRSDTDRRYPVLYLLDGQNMFSSAGPDACYGWGPWSLDRIAAQGAEQGWMQEIILVAIDHSASRYQEYKGPSPRRRTATLSPTLQVRSVLVDPDETSAFERHRRFLIEELKPAIDREFRTLCDPGSTGLLGASMGGLCALWMGWEEYQHFGLVGCLSGSFQVEKARFLAQVLGKTVNGKRPLKIYLDSGATDDSGGDDNAQLTATAARHLSRMGWEQGRDLMWVLDKQVLGAELLKSTDLPPSRWEAAMAGQHNEFYWRRRVGQALKFFFPA